VTKINQYEWGQQRGLLITSKHVHNMKKEDIKRSIPLKDILGVSVTTESEGNEFVVHVNQDYDYRFICDK
jgi:propanediol utilization protein